MDQSQLSTWLYIGSSSVLFAAISVVLWKFSDRLATLISVNATGEPVMLNLSYEEAFRIVLRLFGLILVISSIELLAKEIIQLSTVNLDRVDLATRLSYFVKLTNPLLKVLVGLYLFTMKPRHRGQIEQNNQIIE